MATDILHFQVNPFEKNQIGINQNQSCRAAYAYDYNNVITSSGICKNENKTILPYVETVICYLLTGKVNNVQDYIVVDKNVKHLDIEIEDFKVNNVLNLIRRNMKLKDKDTSPIVMHLIFTKTYFYLLDVYLRCFDKIDLSVRLYECNESSVQLCIEWFNIDIDDKAFNIELYAECRYCHKQVAFCNNILQVYYCSQHGTICDEKHIMYYAKQKDHESKCRVNVPNSHVPDNGLCPYLKKYGKCSHTNCLYAHNELELEIWKFLNKNKISIQLLASNQQKSKSISIKYNNKSHFERNKVLHKIINDGDINDFKQFIKYSNVDILNDYNELNESILHVAVRNKNYEIIKLILDGEELRNCFDSNDLANCQYYSFINHKSSEDFTPFELLLNNNSKIDENLEKIFILFLECRNCEIGKALKICDQKGFQDFERKLIERLYFEEVN
jgi:hypothetical protein